MSAQPLEPEYAEMPLPDLAAVHTYASGPTSNPPLCLAVRHEPGDPMPMICARAVHLPDDPRHLTYHYGNYEQTTWTEEEQD